MEKMSFQEFQEKVVDKIREYLPDNLKSAEVELHTVMKANSVRLTGLTIREAGCNVTPTIYLENFFREYMEGEDMDKVLATIAETRVKNDAKDKFEIDKLHEFEHVKGHILPRLCAQKWNQDLLKEQPHTLLEDLAVTYYIDLGQQAGANGTASIAVTNPMLEQWGVTVEELHVIAIQNMRRLDPGTIEGMTSMLAGMMGGAVPMGDVDAADEAMFVLANESRVFGASAILDKEFMVEALETIRCKRVICLPSSRHEWILLPDGPDIDAGVLSDMVKAVNSENVEDVDRLADGSVYRYTVQEGLKLICD